MIVGLRPYPVMKESGIPWLGQVPKRWQLRRTKVVLANASRRAILTSRCLPPRKRKALSAED